MLWSIKVRMMSKYEYVNERAFKLNNTVLDMAYAVELLNMKEEEIERLKEQLDEL